MQASAIKRFEVACAEGGKEHDDCGLAAALGLAVDCRDEDKDTPGPLHHNLSKSFRQDQITMNWENAPAGGLQKTVRRVCALLSSLDFLLVDVSIYTALNQTPHLVYGGRKGTAPSV